VQERIAEDPSILGIGELILKDRERNQLGAERLDLLFQDPDSNLRYEMEIQLGKTDVLLSSQPEIYKLHETQHGEGLTAGPVLT
jgi:hypothetical protein